MNVFPTPTLAVDWFDLIFWGIVGISVIVSWVSNAAKTGKKGQKRSLEQMVRDARARMEQQGKSGGGDSGRPSASSGSEIDTLATRRRQQLQELARKHRSTPSGGATTPGQRSKPISSAASGPSGRGAQLQRARELAQKQQQARQSKPVRAGSTPKPPSRSTPPRQPPRQPAKQSPPPQQQVQKRSQRSRLVEATEHGSSETGGRESIVRRESPVTRSVPAKGSRTRARGIARFGSLRDAIVLKEILDPPLGLRDLIN